MWQQQQQTITHRGGCKEHIALGPVLLEAVSRHELDRGGSKIWEAGLYLLQEGLSELRCGVVQALEKLDPAHFREGEAESGKKDCLASPGANVVEHLPGLGVSEREDGVEGGKVDLAVGERPDDDALFPQLLLRCLGNLVAILLLEQLSQKRYFARFFVCFGPT